MVPDITQKARLVGVDLPGFGGSEPDPEMTSMEAYADWLHEFKEAIGLDSFVIAGHSMGGYIAMAYLEKYPEGVETLVMIHSHAGEDRPFKKENRNRTIRMIREYSYERWVESWARDLFYLQRQEYIDRVLELASRTSEEVAINALKAMRNRRDRTEVLNQLAIPVYFIVGRYDTVVDYHDLRLQVLDAPTAKSIMMENVGHMGMYEAHEACSRAILGAVARMETHS